MAPIYDHVIEVDMKQAAAQLAGTSLSINDMLHLKVAQQLGLLDQDQEQEYSRLEENNDELRYYAYNTTQAGVAGSFQEMLRASALIEITQKLSKKRYMLVVENLDEPINPIKLSDLTEGLWLPPPRWASSFWLVSTTSQYVYDKSKPDYGCVFESFTGDDILILTLYSLKQAAKYISRAVGQHEDEKYWHRVAIQCFHYATMLLIPHSSKVDNNPPEFDVPDDVNSNKLIRHWASQGILPVIRKQGIPDTADSKYNGDGDDIYQVGNVILEAFREYSLLHLPSSPAKQGDEATKTAAHFLAYHGLIAEHLKLDALCEDNNQLDLLERTQWISHVGDQGWHLSREWPRQGSSGPTVLIIKHCSQHSKLFTKLESDHFFAKLPCLHVLDLSYTPLKSLPPSICYLQELQYLSLRGCYNLTSPFSFPNTEITHLSEINSSKKNLNLLCFDLSYSNINVFHSDFFYSMPYLQELFLVKCSNLEELPPSVASLSSVEKLELTGTQIKSFPGHMFEEMKRLGSAKTIENKELFFAPGLFSKASGLTDLYIEGCESITEVEVTLERHPTLRSFTFICASHMKRLSLRGCRKLEYIDIKEMGALEELDLSATAIKELPDSIPNLPKLRKLLLLGVPSLKRFPWHKLQRLPDVFCLDQCSNRTINHSDHPQGAQVCVSDSRLFYSFNDFTRDLVRTGKLLTTFYVRVTSCKSTSSNKLKDEEDRVMINKVQMAPPAYADVNRLYLTDGVSMVSMDDVPPCRVSERHVEISAADRYPHGLYYLLRVTKSISMWDDTHVSCLNYLSDLDELEECKLRWCHKTVHVFKGGISNLKNASVSHLKSLTHLYTSWYYSGHFFALKHLALQYCPRLEGIVPRYCELPRLETLDIFFCYNIKAIFYDDGGHSSSGDYKLPCLRRIRLQELPLLEHLHVDNPMLTAPAWEELHVRGCWSLCRLPRFRQQPDKAVLSWDRRSLHTASGSSSRATSDE